MGWILGFGLAAAVVFFVARPLAATELKKRRESGLAQNPLQVRLEGLQEQAAAERQSLEELELDREMGSMEEQDYLTLKERSTQRLETLNEEIMALQRSFNGRVAPAPETFKAALATKEGHATATRAEFTSSGKTKTVESEKLHLKSAIKDKLKCEECATPFRPGDRFCRQCRAPLPILCLNCGKEITEDDRFCSKCGAAVNT